MEIPPAFRTLVVVPTMLTSHSDVPNLVEALEVRFLANRDDNLYFGLLTDFRDADQQTLPEDEPLLQLARSSIEELNEKVFQLRRRMRDRRGRLRQYKDEEGPFFLISSSPPMESTGTAVDGS